MTTTLKDLKPDVKNARKHNPRNIGMIADALREVGVARSGVVDEDLNILAGNGTYEALAEAGIEKVKVVEADGNEWVVVKRKGLTEKQKTRLALFDNRSSETAEWDIDNLKDLLDEDDKIFDDLFDKDELDDLFADDNSGPGELEGEDDAPEPPEEPKTKLGDMYQLGDHFLLCGDSTVQNSVDRLMNGQKANLLITSPPYWNQRDYSQWEKFEHYMEDMESIVEASVIAENGIIFWNIGDDSSNNQHISAKHSIMLEKSGYIFIDSIIWKKQGMTGIRCAHQTTHNLYYPSFSFETCLIFQSDNTKFPEFESKYRDQIPVNNVWEINTDQNKEKKHSAPYPVKLPETAIICYSNNEKNIIYDPFGGSGSTMIACEKMKRLCYMMEIDPAYCDVIVERYGNLFPEKEICLLSGAKKDATGVGSTIGQNG